MVVVYGGIGDEFCDVEFVVELVCCDFVVFGEEVCDEVGRGDGCGCVDYGGFVLFGLLG